MIHQYLAATSNGVQEYMPTASTEAPARSNISAMSVRPLRAAQMRAVVPYLSPTFVLAW